MVGLIHNGFDHVTRDGPSPADFQTELQVMPEQRLFEAILLLAWNDAFGDCNSPVSEKTHEDREHSRDIILSEARRWLTLNFGKWKADRELICHLAGLNPERVAERARQRILAEKRPAKVVQVKFPQKKKRSAPDLNLELQRLLAA